ncbi:hypothetical protein HYV22_03795 [Candidatus Gottesmanbacteria bacterium]|nr:hypothetical protein [Candidatus Gottesmanbacteria bacterium]
MNHPLNPFKNLKLDQEEQEITEAIEKGKVTPVAHMEKEKKRLQAIARATLNKTKNINIRLMERDVQKLKTRAQAEGIPYQTLAASILHRFTASAE